jgi:hypothetical protein
MSQIKKNGIGGILDGILAATSANHADSPRNVSAPENPQGSVHPETTSTDEIPKISARRGRPLGQGKERKIPKEKVTVWLDTALIARYREWSWEARCQLSVLIEDALRGYEKHRQNR